MRSAWITLTASFVVLGITRAVSSMSGILILPIQSELESGRATVTLIVTAHLLAYSAGSAICGLLIDRLGPRSTIAAGGACMGLGLVLMSMGRSLPVLAATYGLLCGAGVALAGMPSNFVIISGRYPERVATATAIAGSGMGIGVLLIIPIAQWSAERLGWRTSTFWMGLGIVAVVSICTLLQKTSETVASRVPRAAADRRADLHGLATSMARLRSVLRNRQWQEFALANFLMGAGVFAVLTHQVAAVSKMGWTSLLAATTLGGVHLLRSASSPFWGFFIDRHGRRALYSLSTLVAVLGIGSLILAEASCAPWPVVVVLFVVAFGVGSAGNLPTNASLGNELFNSDVRGIAWGMTEAAYAAGAAFGAWSAGKLFDLTGNYTAAFSLAALELIASCFLVGLLSPRRARH